MEVKNIVFSYGKEIVLYTDAIHPQNWENKKLTE